jgi:mycothiol synthase
VLGGINNPAAESLTLSNLSSWARCQETTGLLTPNCTGQIAATSGIKKNVLLILEKEQNIMDTKVKVFEQVLNPNIEYRSFQGESDYPIILTLIEGCKTVDELERSDTLEDVARNYSHLVNCDPYQDMLFAQVGNQAVGYCRNWWYTDQEGQWVGSNIAFVLPAWRGHGIGGTFLRFSENRLKQISEELIQEGRLAAGVKRVFSIFITQNEASKEKLLIENGYEPVRYFCEMVRPDLENIPDAVLPDGLEVRPALPEHYQQIWDASHEAFHDHWGYAPPVEGDYERWLAEPTFDPSLWRIAWEGDQVAGMVQSFIHEAENIEFDRLRGYTENISVRRPWRKRGLARALLLLSLQAVKDRGMTEAALGVDSQNLSGAHRLYESVGFKVVKRNAVFQKPVL